MELVKTKQHKCTLFCCICIMHTIMWVVLKRFWSCSSSKSDSHDEFKNKFTKCQVNCMKIESDIVLLFFSLLNITLALRRKIFYCVFLWQLQKIYIVNWSSKVVILCLEIRKNRCKQYTNCSWKCIINLGFILLVCTYFESS